jgi:hypothetical protein
VGLALPVLAQGKKTGTDTIHTSGQVIRRANVLSETLKEVTYKARKKDQSIPSSQVVSIEWGNAGESWQRALFAVERGDFAQAANLFQETATSSERASLKAHASFRAAEALFLAAASDPAKADLAANALDTWLAANADHRLSTQAQDVAGKAWLLAKNPDKALAGFKKLEADATAKSLGARATARAKFGQGQAMVAQKKFAEARTSYLAAAATLQAAGAADDPSLRALEIAAKVGVGECHIAQKNLQEAQRFFSGLKRQGVNDPGLAAAAAAGLAQARFEAAVAKKDVRAVLEAQSAFAEVSATDVMDGDATAKSLYYLGRCLLELGKDREGQDFGTRADAFFKHVIARYSGSRWALRARLALKK